MATGGVASVPTPGAVSNRHTSPLVPSYGPPVLLVVMNREPLTGSSAPFWARKPAGWPGTRCQVLPPLVERYAVSPRSATPTSMVWVALPDEPVRGSKTTQVTPGSWLRYPFGSPGSSAQSPGLGKLVTFWKVAPALVLRHRPLPFGAPR